MRFTEFIGRQTDYMEYTSIKPKYSPCPQCGQKGKRKQVLERRIPHVAALHRRSWIVAEVGVDQARCGCCQSCQAAIPGVPYKGRYSSEVRNGVAPALIRDRMPYRLVIQRMREDCG
jgi:transposase